MNRFIVKPNYGHWSIIDTFKDKSMIVGYSKTMDAIATANGLNAIKDADQLEHIISILKTKDGYGYFLKNSNL